MSRSDRGRDAAQQHGVAVHTVNRRVLAGDVGTGKWLGSLSVCTWAAMVSCSSTPEPTPTPRASAGPASLAGDLDDLSLRNLGLVPVDASDRNRNLVLQEIERIEAGAPGSAVGNKLNRVGRIQGEASRTLFPTWGFYSFVYSNYAKRGFSDHPVSLALFLGHTLAVPADDRAPPASSGSPMRLSHYGNYEPYGELLLRTRTLLRNGDDARLVWEAFCEVHGKRWSNYWIEKISDHRWKLGISRYDQTVAATSSTKTIVQRTHYFEVVTDSLTHEITSWQSNVETSAPRTEPL